MAINIYSVQDAAEQIGWKCLSEEYQNLSSPLLYECPNHHLVTMSYGDWRKSPTCKQCNLKDVSEVQRNVILPKKDASTFRVLALDAATGTTGWAVYDDGKVSAYGTYTAGYSEDIIDKIVDVKSWLMDALTIWRPDGVGIEDIQLQQNVKTFQKLANLQGVILATLKENEIPYIVKTPSEWRSYLGINHGDERAAAKKAAQDWVKLNYHISATQDEADALCMGKYYYHDFKSNKVVDSWGEE